MIPKGKSLQDLEIRRRLAMKLLATGLSQHEVARQVGSSQSSVSRWAKRVREGGEAGLAPVKGRRVGASAFSAEELKVLDALVCAPPPAGYLWTGPRLAEAMAERTGKRVHPTTVLRLLRERGYTRQKPTRCAYRQDPHKEAAFRQQQWPALKKSSQTSSGRSSSSMRRG